MVYNFFYILKNIEERDFYFYEYLSILSLIHTQDDYNIIIYKINNVHGKYYNLLKNNSKISYRDINIYVDAFNDKSHNYDNFKYSLIHTISGIFIDFSVIFIHSIKDIISKYLFNYNEKIIGGCNNNYFLKDIKTFNKDTNLEPCIKHINNKFIEYYKINDSEVEIINNVNEELIIKEITDWNFNKYFEIIENKNKKFIILDFDETYLHNLQNTIHNNNIQQISNKIYITILNLLYIYILSYKNSNLPKTEINKYIEYNLSTKNNIKCINSIDHIYWINLDSSIKRKEKMDAILKNINIANTRINAVNGISEELDIKNTYFEENEFFTYPNNTNIEYAVILSHLKALEEINKKYTSNIEKINNIKNYNVSLICEDDVSLEFLPYWTKNLEQIINNAPEDWEIIMLGYFTLNIHFDSDYRKWDNDWSALSYLINHNSLYKLNEIKKDNKYKTFNDVMAADNYLFRVFNTYVYKYPYFTFPKNNESTIHKDHLQYHSIYKNINYLILDNNVQYL